MPDLTGPELSAAVARALGYEVWEAEEECFGSTPGAVWNGDGEYWSIAITLCGKGEADEEAFSLPPYAEDLADAWQVVEALAERGALIRLEMETDAAIRPRVWTCTMWKGGPRDYTEDGATAPEAICRAALAVLRGAEKTP